MHQISPISWQRAKVGLIMFCAPALMVFLITCRREAQPEQQPQQSPPPQQSQEPQQPQELQQSPRPQESPQSQPSPQSQESPQSQPSPEPQQSPDAQQPQETQEPKEAHARAVADVRAVAASLEDYKSRTGAYPTTAQGLEALGAARKDPWGNDYIYQSPSARGRESYDFFSPGPDRRPDTPDDDWGGSEDHNE